MANLSTVALFRSMFANSLEAVLLTRIDSGRIIATNPTACRLLGYEEAELLTLSRNDLVDTGDPRVGIVLAQRDRAGVAHGVVVFMRKDKSLFAAEVSSSLFQDEHDATCATIFMRDISGQVTRKQHVQESEERLRFGLDAAGIGEWDLDLRTDVARRSLWHDRLFGYAEAVPVWGYDTFLAHVAGEDRGRVDGAFKTALGGAGDYDVEFRTVWPDGSVHWLWSKGHFYFDEEGKPYRVAGIQVEVTNRRTAEEALKALNAELEERVRQRTTELELANRELESFSYSVSHDLRGPLNVIAGFSQLITADRSNELPQTTRNYLQHIDTSAQRMQGLIEDILRMARVGRAELKRIPTDLTLMAHEIINELKARDATRTVAVSIGAGLQTNADAPLVRILLENLLGNAWKYSGKRADAKIEFARHHDDVFLVRDNGVGFDMKDAERIFRGFQRLNADKDFKGTGVGLNTVQRVVQCHGGRVWAEATPDAGATFFFRLSPEQRTET